MQMITPICKLVSIIRLSVSSMTLAGKLFQKQLKVMQLHQCGEEFSLVSLKWRLFDFYCNLPVM